jgi:acetoin utilization deacetylase AcuC-like enzyme
MKLNTGYLFTESFLRHELEPGHPESPERLIAINKRIRESDAADWFMPIRFSFNADEHLSLIRAVHTQTHIDEVRAIPDTSQAACDAVAAVITAVDNVFSGTVDNAFCAVRPPGHHAHNSAHHDGINQGEGFCFFNNAAIAARYAQKKFGAEKILIADWDYHHGNGTESYFYNDPSVFYFSTHRYGTYPGTGIPTRTGNGAGKGFTLNYPLPRPGIPFDPVTDRDFLDALSILDDAMKMVAFSPDFIIISAGFDGLAKDFLGNFSLSEEVFYRATQILTEIAARFCDNHIVSVLEGGYHPASMASAVEYHMKALSGYPIEQITLGQDNS